MSGSLWGRLKVHERHANSRTPVRIRCFGTILAMIRQIAIFLLVLLSFSAPGLFAGNTETAGMPSEIEIDGRRLVLNGSGLWRILVFEPYAAGLYLKRPGSDGLSVMEADEPMAVRLLMKETMDRRMMIRALYNGMLASAEALGGDFSMMRGRFEDLADFFPEQLREGDVYEFHYVPRKGLRLVKNSRSRGNIAGLDFKGAFFGAWLNPGDPIDEPLRIALLGGAPESGEGPPASEEETETVEAAVAEAFPVALPSRSDMPDSPDSPDSPEGLSGKDIRAFEAENVYFGFDDATLTGRAERVLDEKAAWLQANPDTNIAVEVYADHRGSASYNRRLSERRAANVVFYLAGKGVDPSRMETVIHGSEGLEEIGKTPEERARNRRASFRVLR